jgi:hypothetical protein
VRKAADMSNKTHNRKLHRSRQVPAHGTAHIVSSQAKMRSESLALIILAGEGDELAPTAGGPQLATYFKRIALSSTRVRTVRHAPVILNLRVLMFAKLDLSYQTRM